METRSNSRQKVVVKKQQQEKNRDRISNLPDTILHHIFSFLDMKVVVRASILSKRWRYLWTTLPHLNFFSNIHLYQEKTHKLDFVDRVFVLRNTSSNIQSLHFNIGSTPVLPSLNVIKGHLTTWILAALKCSIRYLSIEFSFATFYDLHSNPRKRKTSIIKKDTLFKFPDCLFTRKSLMSLVLKTNHSRQHFKTCLPAANSIMSLPLLKTLHLASITLEALIIKDCEFHCCSTGINISSLKLKHLEIEECSMISDSAAADHQPVEIEFKLNAPVLISFSIKDCMSKDYTLVNLYSLKKANIDMDVKVEEDGGGVHRNNTSTTQLELPEERKRLYAQRMVKCLKALRFVKDLTLSPWFIEVVSGAADLLEIRLTPFWSVRCLELKTWFSRDCIHSIAYLLQIYPSIETLSIEVTRKNPTESMRWDKTNLDSLNTRDYWEPGSSMECRLNHLKVVKFRGYLGCNDLKFFEFLLKNARVLEKLTIGFSYNGYVLDQKKRVTKFAEMLHAFPRASSRLTIMFL